MWMVNLVGSLIEVMRLFHLSYCGWKNVRESTAHLEIEEVGWFHDTLSSFLNRRNDLRRRVDNIQYKPVDQSARDAIRQYGYDLLLFAAAAHDKILIWSAWDWDMALPNRS